MNLFHSTAFMCRKKNFVNLNIEFYLVVYATATWYIMASNNIINSYLKVRLFVLYDSGEFDYLASAHWNVVEVINKT